MDEEVYLKLLTHIENRLRYYPELGDRDDKWQFFSALDDSYRRPWLVDSILESIWLPNLVLTGQFGRYVVKRLEVLGLKKDYILFNGHIREGDPPVEEAYMTYGKDIDSKSPPFVQTWLLLDDSNYSGRTRFVLDEYMRNSHSHPITQTVVIYNGAPNFHPQINALYSWYMIHGLDVKQ